MQNAKTIIKQLEDSIKVAREEGKETIPVVAIKSIVDVFRKDQLSDLQKGVKWAKEDVIDSELELKEFKDRHPDFFKEEVK
tara:strand:- start:207 stop:449 length:243 start_codon:yes stop_codon:yes gene_type:complete